MVVELVKKFNYLGSLILENRNITIGKLFNDIKTTFLGRKEIPK